MEHRGFRTARPVARLRAGRTDWYRIENNARSDKASIYIYDEIGYVGVSAQDFVRDLVAVQASQIELHLDTPGGDVFDGIAIFNAIKDHPAHVTVIVDAMAASAGSFIAQAGDTRIMNRNSQMMIHDAHGLAVGNARDMSGFADLLDKQSDNIASIYADRTGQTVAFWRELMRDETWYSAQEAVDAGLADEVAGKTVPVPQPNDFDLTIFSYAGRDQAPAPVIGEPEQASEGIDWSKLSDAFKGVFA